MRVLAKVILSVLIASSAWQGVRALVLTIIIFNTPGTSDRLLERACVEVVVSGAFTFLLICLFRKVGNDKKASVKPPPIPPPVLQRH
jgi:hypothetical protein